MTLDYIQALYNAVRNRAGVKYNPDNYHWVLGMRIKFTLCPTDLLGNGEPRLFDIPVEWDIKNPDTVRIYEDITDILEREVIT